MGGAAGIEIIQMPPKTIKHSVIISGNANKALVQRMVASILCRAVLPPDEADAAAAAIAASKGRNAAGLQVRGTYPAAVLRSLFFSDAGADEVSRRIGVSVQRVRQIRDAGLRHMAEILR